MNDEFEAMPFDMEGGMEYEWESERGMRPMGRGKGAARGPARGGGGRGGSARPAGSRVLAKPSPMGRPVRSAKPGGPGRAGRAGQPARPGMPGGQTRPGRPDGPGRPGRPGYPGRPWPGRWPYYGPYYGGVWPYAGVVLEPTEPAAPPEPSEPTEPDDWSDAAAPQEEPAFDDGTGTAPAEGEVPPTLAGTMGRLPAVQRPAYVALGAITNALRDSRATGAGFYLIEFTVNGVRRAYSGQTGNLRRRLQQHALCGQMMGLPLSAHSVYVAQSSLPDAQRRAVEYRIHDDMFRNSAGVLTNQRRELEAELFGNEWR